MNVKAMAEQMRTAGHYECGVAAHNEGAFYDWAVQVEALQQQLAAAREALQAAEADAARYRWLREHGNSFFNAANYRASESMDAAIDAALNPGGSRE